MPLSTIRTPLLPVFSNLYEYSLQCIDRFLHLCVCGGLHPTEFPRWPRMKMSTKTRTAWGGQADQSFRGKGPEPLSQWALIGFSLGRNTGRIYKAHQSLSGSNDQGI